MTGGLGTGIVLNDWPTRSPATIRGTSVIKLCGRYLKQHWPVIREQLLNGTYEPKPVRRVEIPKPDGGGVRKLGIPTVLDRFIQKSISRMLAITM
jgi:RNA-directed DNA polymerase